MNLRSLPLLVCLLLLGAGAPPLAVAGTFPAFGPRDFVRAQEKPTVFSESFTVLDPTVPYTLRVENGGRDAQYAKVSSAVVSLNGTQILGPRDWNQNVTLIERPLVLAADNELAVELRGRPGGGITLEITGVDEVAPELTLTLEPPEPVIAEPPRIVLAYADRTAGVDLESLRVAVDGTELTASCEVTDGSASCPPPELGDGLHEVSTEIADRAGNVATATAAFELLRDREPPVVTLTSPAADALVSTPVVTVRGTATDDGEVVAVAVNGRPAVLDGESFSAEVALEEYRNRIEAAAVDSTGKRGVADVTVTLDTTAPFVELTSPPPGQATHGESVRFAGRALDASGVARVEVAGVAVDLAEGGFEHQVALAAGRNVFAVTAEDRAGNVAGAEVEVLRVVLPEVAITAPADLGLTLADVVEVAGTVGASVVEVTVNGRPAILDGTTFRAAGVALAEGANRLVAVARAGDGRVATASVTVFRDRTPPRLHVDTPAAGAVLRRAAIAVQGRVEDAGPGEAAPKVEVNGQPAVVADGTFLAEDVVLVPGDNPIAVNAVDASGNRSEARLVVALDESPAAAIRIVAGDRQEAPIGSPLPAPMAVELRGADGQPAAGVPVVFEVRGNDGFLGDGERLLAVETDADGRAAARFTLGRRAGLACQVVAASATGFGPPALFRHTARPAAPALVVVDTGNQQSGTAGRPLPLPFGAAVVDEGSNRLAGVPVTFTVVEGGGTFADGSTALAVDTDVGGLVSAVLTLGPEEGVANNVVEAAVASGARASFVASGRVAGDPAATSVSGRVLDNSDRPVPGATVHIEHTELVTTSDAEGRFRLDGAPVGEIHLIVDGSTTPRPGVWPMLAYRLVTVPGRDNTVGMPIYLLPIDVERGLFVDDLRGGTLTLPEMPGFALEIAPGSVSFPGGGDSGVVSVTVVHSDKVPMTPNFGQQPRFVVTIQPMGALFDPPARLTLPNTDGLTPGAVTELYSFDHDLDRFVPIGLSTVSEDATRLVSNPGVGVLKAGWHCGGNPTSTGSAHQCPLCCFKCVGNRCEYDSASDGKPCDDCGNAPPSPPVTSATLREAAPAAMTKGGTGEGEVCRKCVGRFCRPYRITSVRWEPVYPDRFGINEGSRGGKKIFPGHENPGEIGPLADRATIRVVATIDLALEDENLKVYFKAFDVDDPFDNEHRNDQSSAGRSRYGDLTILDPDNYGAKGGDNRGCAALIDPGFPYRACIDFSQPGILIRETEAPARQGRAEAVFRVSMRPGDNFRIGAFCKQQNRSLVGDDDVPADNEEAIVLEDGSRLPGLYTEMLTVWRKLHLEIDSMKAGKGDHLFPNLRLPIRNVFVSRFELVDVRHPVTNQLIHQEPTLYVTPPLAYDAYEGGRIGVAGNSLLIARNTEDRVVVADPNGTASQLVHANVELRDDDALIEQNGELVTAHLPIVSLRGITDVTPGDVLEFIRGVYADAYIDVEELSNALNPTQLVDFDPETSGYDLQIEGSLGIGAIAASNVQNNEYFWNHLVVMIYQDSTQNGDPDHFPNDSAGRNLPCIGCRPLLDPPSTQNCRRSPPSECYTTAGSWGVTPALRLSPSFSAIYTETIFDLGVSGWKSRADFKRTIAHEVAHAVRPPGSSTGDAHHAEGGLMMDANPVGDRETESFKAQTLARLRQGDNDSGW